MEKPGRATAAVLAEAIPAIVRAFPWPKSMRWGEASASTESQRWVRPLHGIVALLGEEIVDVRDRRRHSRRRHASATASTIPARSRSAARSDYVEKLRACHVIVDQEERKAIIREARRARRGSTD